MSQHDDSSDSNSSSASSHYEHIFKLDELEAVVNRHFNRACSLVKLTQGGSHSIFEVFKNNGDEEPIESLDAIVRVAFPSFPHDKLCSEVATLAYIASHTSVPVPAVYAWNADASNPIGAEYMIMQKIRGETAFANWDHLSIDIKENVVKQVARHLASLFRLKFPGSGSLYFSSDVPIEQAIPVPRLSTTNDSTEYCIGPVVSDRFFTMIDGNDDYPTTGLHTPGTDEYKTLQSFRGPFHSAADFVVHPLRALLYKCSTFPKETIDRLDVMDLKYRLSQSTDPETVHANNKKIFHRAISLIPRVIEIAQRFPDTVTTPADNNALFTIWWPDFHLMNLMIDKDTGEVTGLIDFEEAMLVPMWWAATVPQCVPDPDSDMADWYGGTPAEQRRLWNTFDSTMDLYAPEWRKSYELGRSYRELGFSHSNGVRVFGLWEFDIWLEEWLESALEKSH